MALVRPKNYVFSLDTQAAPCKRALSLWRDDVPIMKIALLSDLHANLPALDACLEHARAQGAEQFALLGDLVGYGADPGSVLDRVM